MNGSGTTALLDHLNSHSRIFGFKEETKVLPYYIQHEYKYGNLSEPQNLRRLWHDLCSAFPFWKVNGQKPIPIPDDWDRRERSAAGIFDYILSRFAAQEGKLVWCEKTPMYALQIDTLAAALPHSRFIHIIRDGRDCAASFNRRWGYHPDTTIYRWKNTIRTARSAASRLPQRRYFEIRFEALTARPTDELRRVSDFLGIAYEKSILTTMRDKTRVRGIGNTQLTPNSGLYRTYFPLERIQRLEEIAGAQLHALGYTVGNPTGDEDLSGAQVWLQQTYDQIRRLSDIMRETRSSKQPLRLLLRRIKSGLQYKTLK